MPLHFGEIYSTVLTGQGVMSIIPYEDGSAKIYFNGSLSQSLPAGSLKYEGTNIIDTSTNEVMAVISENGTKIEMEQMIFVLSMPLVKFGEPYSTTSNDSKVSYIFHENGSAEQFINNTLNESFQAGSIGYYKDTIIIGNITGIVSSDGTSITLNGETLTLDEEFCKHENTEVVNATDIYTGDTICTQCGAKIEESKIVIPESGVYFVGVTSINTGDYTGYTAYYTDEEDFPSTPANGDVFVKGDYEYKYNYNYSNGWVENSEQNGWSVRVLDTQKDTYGSVLGSVNGLPVTSLDFTFQYCEMINAPDISACESVTTMKCTFRNCNLLVSAPNISEFEYLTDMTSTFIGCRTMMTYAGSTDNAGDFSEYVIPSSVTGLNNTFQECDSLVKPPIVPNGVTELNSTFFGCGAIVDLSDFVIPNGVKELNTTFVDCDSLTVLPTIPNTVVELGATFYGCDALTDASSFVIPDSVKDISQLFDSCSALTTAPIIPSNVENIRSVFKNCTALTGTITINAKLSYVCTDALSLESQGKDIILTGSSEDLQEIAETSTSGYRIVYDVNGNVLHE